MWCERRNKYNGSINTRDWIMCKLCCVIIAGMRCLRWEGRDEEDQSEETDWWFNYEAIHFHVGAGHFNFIVAPAKRHIPPTLLWPLLVSPFIATLGIPLMFYCNLICYNFVSLFAFYIAFRLSRAAISSENEPFFSLLPSRFNSQFAVRCRRPGVKELNGRCEMPTTFASSPRLN